MAESLTNPLLTAILNTYPILPEHTRRAAFEEQFYLLVPPILNIIDHHATASKISGYRLLSLLSAASLSAKSSILNRSGLTDVFIDSLKTNFLLLPSLTSENDSLAVLEELYPAYHALLRARFMDLPPTTTTKFTITPEIELRVKYLTLLLRHGILAGLGHLNAPSPTTHVRLTTFLLGQLTIVVQEMGVFASRDLDSIIPLARSILMDPFTMAAPEMVEEAISVLEAVVKSCEERVRDRWWGEVLRGLVGCWCNVVDEEKESEGLRSVQGKLKDAAKGLGKAVGHEEWKDAKRRLIEEEEDLQGLFEEI